MTTKAARYHKSKLAGMGCMVCRRLWNITDGPVVLHHRRGGNGGWGKGDYTTLIPVCFEHHVGKTGIHGMGTKAFPQHYGFTEADLLADVQLLLSKKE